MRGDAKRIRALRERSGKSSHDIAALAGLGDMEYFDLEAYDDELMSVPSLAKIKRLAVAFGVPTPALFLDEPNIVRRHIPYAELVWLVKAHLAAGTSKEVFEEQIGWDLDPFFDSEERALSEYGVEFLKALCRRLDIQWIAALP
jgi:transcriptional regulator with XRE-family HTH domain